MVRLNLPEYELKIRKTGLQTEILDPVRKKYIKLTPEEWVRQNFLMYLVHEKGVPQSHLKTEAGFLLNKMTKRFDILVSGKNGEPLMLVECKAPEIKIDQKVFDQVARYNMVFKVHFLIVTNGISHFCCMMDFENRKYHFLEEIPLYTEMLT
ncbi:MAG: type I restriction enzyme HsdR N-terminal domain-containing protein [Bacteroidales bacterium]|nr:type I restriction enzyme HsdR N-terminal domain-containing protein [Bacteroidales bacterium]